MIKKPFYSIIICCYNSQKYLFDTLMSVKDQTFSDWEIIIVDDGSKDNTFQIINDFKKIKKIKLYIFIKIIMDMPQLEIKL